MAALVPDLLPDLAAALAKLSAADSASVPVQQAQLYSSNRDWVLEYRSRCKVVPGIYTMVLEYSSRVVICGRDVTGVFRLMLF